MSGSCVCACACACVCVYTDLAEFLVSARSPGTNTSYTGFAFATSDWALQYAAFGLRDAALQGVGGDKSWIRAIQVCVCVCV